MIDPNRPLILGVTGASGLIYAVRTLKYALAAGGVVDLVASKASQMVWQAELGIHMPLAPNPRKNSGVNRPGYPRLAPCAAIPGGMWGPPLPVDLFALRVCW
jgi:4-hydroxy-3-polyprenylbenzoate decarboxylase